MYGNEGGQNLITGTTLFCKISVEPNPYPMYTGQISGLRLVMLTDKRNTIDSMERSAIMLSQQK